MVTIKEIYERFTGPQLAPSRGGKRTTGHEGTTRADVVKSVLILR
jgi:hypothetical protein